MFLSPQALPDRGLKLYAKKLLYSVDLNIEWVEKGEDIFLSAQGPARLGPLSQNINIKTTYRKTEPLQFKSHNFELKNRLSYDCQLEEGELCLQNSKSSAQEKLEPLEEAWWDPLGLLLQVRKDLFNDDLAESYNVLTNQKFSKLVRKEDSKGVFFERKGKKQFYLQIRGQDLLIEIPAFKAQLTLS